MSGATHVLEHVGVLRHHHELHNVGRRRTEHTLVLSRRQSRTTGGLGELHPWFSIIVCVRARKLGELGLGDAVQIGVVNSL